MRKFKVSSLCLLFSLLFIAGCDSIFEDDHREKARNAEMDRQIEALMKQIDEMKNDADPLPKHPEENEQTDSNDRKIAQRIEHLKSLIDIQESPSGPAHALETYIETNETMRTECRSVLEELETCRAQLKGCAPDPPEDASPSAEEL